MPETLEDYVKDLTFPSPAAHREALRNLLFRTYGGFLAKEKSGLKFYTITQLKEILFIRFTPSFSVADILSSTSFLSTLEWRDLASAPTAPHPAPTAPHPAPAAAAPPPDDESSTDSEEDESPPIPSVGGSYLECLQKKSDPEHQHAHHIISKAALTKWWYYTHWTAEENHRNDFDDLLHDPNQEWAPAILMTQADHEQTRTYTSNSNPTKKQDAFYYINNQAAELIYNADFLGAFYQEYDSINQLFGTKYEDALRQAEKYMLENLKVHQDSSHVLWVQGKQYHRFDIMTINPISSPPKPEKEEKSKKRSASSHRRH